MLIMTMENIDGINIDVVLSNVCSIHPVDKNRAKREKPGYKPDWDKETCGLAMNNGVVLHVKKPITAIRSAIAGYGNR